jgi:hypothetical protein
MIVDTGPQALGGAPMTPTPLGSPLWRIVLMDDAGYSEG